MGTSAPLIIFFELVGFLIGTLFHLIYYVVRTANVIDAITSYLSIWNWAIEFFRQTI